MFHASAAKTEPLNNVNIAGVNRSPLNNDGIGPPRSRSMITLTNRASGSTVVTGGG